MFRKKKPKQEEPHIKIFLTKESVVLRLNDETTHVEMIELLKYFIDGTLLETYMQSIRSQISEDDIHSMIESFGDDTNEDTPIITPINVLQSRGKNDE